MIPYIGGKYRQSKWISGYMPQHIKTYVEVFGGAFWVHLRSSFTADEVIYNDFNRFMCNLFACAREYNTFHEYLVKDKPQNQELFNEYKKEILSLLDEQFDIPNFDIGQKYAYVITQVFSGIMSEKVKMVNLKDKYKSKYIAFSDKMVNPSYQQRFDMITGIENLSFEQVIPKYDSPDTFFYVDPPYYGTENLYAFHDFGLRQHEELKDILKSCQGKWILSYYEFDDLKKWFPEDIYVWKRKEYAKASMASNNKKQTKGVEVLVMNYDPNTFKNIKETEDQEDNGNEPLESFFF
jgi:DNA adenine methylase